MDARRKTIVVLQKAGDTHLASLRKLPKDLYLGARQNKANAREAKGGTRLWRRLPFSKSPLLTAVKLGLFTMHRALSWLCLTKLHKFTRQQQRRRRWRRRRRRMEEEEEQEEEEEEEDGERSGQNK